VKNVVQRIKLSNNHSPIVKNINHNSEVLKLALKNYLLSHSILLMTLPPLKILKLHKEIRETFLGLACMLTYVMTYACA